MNLKEGRKEGMEGGKENRTDTLRFTKGQGPIVLYHPLVLL